MVTIVLLSCVAPIRLVEYLDGHGRSAYAKWFDSLNAPAAAKVAAAVYQLAAGNFSNVKGVGSGVLERKIELGRGYRVYFGREGEILVILLGGSSKQRQTEAMAAAKARWTDYRRRKA